MRPTKTQIYFLAGFWAIAAIVTFYLSRKEVAKNPYLSDKAEESRGDSELLNIQESIEHYRHEIRRNPDAANNYIDLASLKLQQVRITGDDRSCLQQARRLIDQALSKEPNNDAAMITQAAICLNYHHFEEAKSLAHKVVARNSHNAYAWGVYSDALKELGQYDAAVAACDKMLSLRPDLPVIICTGFNELLSKERAQDLGIRALLMKPFLKNEAARLIRQVLDQAASA